MQNAGENRRTARRWERIRAPFHSRCANLIVRKQCVFVGVVLFLTTHWSLQSGSVEVAAQLRVWLLPTPQPARNFELQAQLQYFTGEIFQSRRFVPSVGSSPC